VPPPPSSKGAPARITVEAGVAGLAGLALALAMSWPLVLHLGRDIGKDTGDPLFQTWQVAWIGHAVWRQPLELFQANIFWPLADTLAFSDALVGYAPAGLVAQLGPHAALVVYNLLFVFAYALAFFGAYLLARELGAGRAGAVAAGAAFAYAPWRLTQSGHLHVLSSGGLPLSLFLLVRGHRSGSAALVLGGWLVVSWQMTLGFTLGLQLAYLTAALAVVAAVARRRGRLAPATARVLAATSIGVGALVLVTVLMSRPYFRVVAEHPEARRTPAEIERFSPTLRSFLAVPRQSFLADIPFSESSSLSDPDERSLFPGLTIALLALAGLTACVYSRGLRLGLAAGVTLCAALSLGLRDAAGAEAYVTPYRLLYEFAPGWDAIRTPGRINTLTSLGLALLAGAGVCALAERFRRLVGGAGRSWSRVVPAGFAALLVAAILTEGLGPLAHPRVPKPPPGQRDAAAPQLHLPWGFYDLRFTYWSTAGFPSIVNGAGGFFPAAFDRLWLRVQGFPDARSVAALRTVGVRTVVLHPELTPGTPWQGAATRSTAALDLDRKRVGRVVLYRLSRRDPGG